MKRSLIALLISIAALTLTSCERSVLEPWPPDAAIESKDVWGNYYYTRGVLDHLYAANNICGHWNELQGYGCTASACDEAEDCDPSAKVQIFTNGLWNLTNSPTVYYGSIYYGHSLMSPWQNSYIGIRRVNLFLENIDNSVFIDDPDNPVRAHDRTYWKGQAYFWRAFLYWDLFRRYGTFVPIDHALDISEDDMLYSDRTSLENCVQLMLKNCDSAIMSLPLLWDEDNWHRANRTAAQTLKAKILVYYASPLYQGKFEEWGLKAGEVGDVQRWIDAVDACRTAINDNDFYNLEIPSVWKRPWSQTGTYDYVIGLTGNTENHEQIFETGFSTTSSTNNEKYCMPSEIDGCSGHINPTQEMVDAFEVVTGKGATRKAEPFDWNNPAHAKAPYENRDYRFYNAIMYNGMVWGSSSAKAYTIYTYEEVDAEHSPDGVAHVGGTHRNRKLPYYTKTGYFNRKFLDEACYSFKSSSYYSTPKRGRWEFRFTDLLLLYAEAMNEAYGPDFEDPQGGLREINGVGFVSTARQAVNAVRARAQMPDLEGCKTKDEMRAAIHHERQVELCFESQRFFDLRRWKEAEDVLSKPIHGIEITPTAYSANGIPKTYDYKVVKVEERHWENKYYWWPIPYTEISKYRGKLTQSPGWE